MKLLSLLPLMLLIGCPSAPKDSDSTDTGTTPLTDNDGDGFTSDVDCDDTLADVNPDAPEICDDVDNDCDGQIDGASATDAATWYADTDGDSYGDPDSLTADCAQPEGYTADMGDCDDADGDINPGVSDDSCDGIDQNCDGVPDDGAGGSSAWYLDADGDGFGDPSTEMILCEEPLGYIADGSDCDDADPSINPDAIEVCDEVDQDCDGTVDDDAADAPLWYTDGDRDGYGTGDGFRSCLQPPDVSSIGGDCDDADPAYNPAADETYTAIFPMGVAWYIAAPLDEQEPRYKALIARVEKTLPANDHARKALVPVVTQGLKDFEKATRALDKATLAADLGLSGYRSARTAWRRYMDRLYSALRADHGADYAERFFPRVSARGKKTATPAGETLPQG